MGHSARSLPQELEGREHANHGGDDRVLLMQPRKRGESDRRREDTSAGGRRVEGELSEREEQEQAAGKLRVDLKRVEEKRYRERHGKSADDAGRAARDFGDRGDDLEDEKRSEQLPEHDDRGLTLGAEPAIQRAIDEVRGSEENSRAGSVM